MAIPPPPSQPESYAFDLGAASRAARAWQAHSQRRRRNMDAVARGDYEKAETPERMASRVNHLMGQVRRRVASEGARQFLPSTLVDLMEKPAVTSAEVSSALFERVLGETRDFLGVEFLTLALDAVNPVGRILTRLPDGRSSLGTGFLVSPRLLLTNHHVLETAEVADRSQVEFDYQRGRDGFPMSVRRFSLDPESFFLADERLDYALVAVRAPEPFSTFLRLIGVQGKISLGERINIIQHPLGRLKEVVIRENRLLDLPEEPSFAAHYEADTEPGSSGSPVFNDSWEVVALHHSGVPDTDAEGRILDVDGRPWRQGDPPQRIRWVANEGIRVSSLIGHLRNASLTGAQGALRDEVVAPTEAAEAERGVGPAPVVRPPFVQRSSASSARRSFRPEASAPSASAPGTVSITIPLHVTVSLGSAGAGAPVATGMAALPELQERVTASELNGRPGYDPAFLGFSAPMPQPRRAMRHLVFVQPETEESELRYLHFSLILHRDRRLAFVSAGNFDITAPFRQPRDRDPFRLDPRVGDFQAGESLYSGNPLDRGHLFRRAAGAWGHSAEEARTANDDTYFFPNIAPQHESFNRSNRSGLWGLLENHVASEARSEAQPVSVFNGPIFRDDDRLHRDLGIPRDFWKVIVYQGDDGSPRAAGFVLSQAGLISNLREEDFAFGEFEIHQRPIRSIAEATGLDFGPVEGFDVLGRPGSERLFESAVGAGLSVGDLSRVVL